jgi:hypothetical protein
LNTFTASVSTASLVTSISNLNTATSSYETKGRSIVSGSSQLTSSYDGRYTQTGSFNSYTSSFSSSLASSITSVSGSFTNLTVNGQPTTYGYVNSSYLLAQNNAEQTGVGNGTAISFQTTSASNGSLITKGSNTQVTLTAGNTYKLEAIIRRFTSTSTWGAFRWYDVTNSTYVGIEAFGEVVNSTGAIGSTLVATHYVTPSVNTTYELRQTTANTITVSSAYASIEITQLNPTIAVQATATGTLNTDYISVTNTTSTSANYGATGASRDVILDTNLTSQGIAYNASTGVYTLTAGKTYRITSTIGWYNTTPGYINFNWVDSSTNTAINSITITQANNSWATDQIDPLDADFIYTPVTNQSIKMRVYGSSNNTFSIMGGGTSKVVIQQIANTFSLNALDTMQISNSLAVTGSTTLKGAVNIGTGSGAEGGELTLAYAQTGNTLTGSAVSIDVYQDRLRIFEGGGTTRGAYLNMVSQSAGVGSEILTRTSTNILATPAWTSAGAITLTATTTNPTKGTTTSDNISYRQLGAKEWEVVMTYVQSATNGTTGTGDYLITLPNGLSFDTTLPSQPIHTGGVGTSLASHMAYIIPNSNGSITNNVVWAHIFPMVYSATKFRILTITYGHGIQSWASGFYSTIDVPKIQLTFRFTST